MYFKLNIYIYNSATSEYTMAVDKIFLRKTKKTSLFDQQ